MRVLKLAAMWERIKRFGKYRVINAECRWGVDLFDDLGKLASLADFQAVIDVGANQGDFSKLFLRHFPAAKIQALEPVQAPFDRLREKLNSEPRVQLHRLAASHATGSAIIRTFASSKRN